MVSYNTRRRINTYVEKVKSLKKSHQTGHFFHATFVCQKRKILAIGFNDYRKYINEQRWGKYTPTRPSTVTEYRASMHSEIAALEKMGRSDIEGCDIVNIRIDNNGDIACSRPCRNCQKVLSKLGYKNLYYFDESGNLVVEKKCAAADFFS